MPTAMAESSDESVQSKKRIFRQSGLGSGTRKTNPESTTTLVLDCGLRHNDKQTFPAAASLSGFRLLPS